MVDNIYISYSEGGNKYSIDVDMSNDNCVYNFVDALCYVIDNLNLNEEMIVDELASRYGLKVDVEQKEKGDSNE